MMGGGDVKLAAALALLVPARRDDQVPGVHVTRRRRAHAGHSRLASGANAARVVHKFRTGSRLPLGGLAILGPILTQRFLNQFV